MQIKLRFIVKIDEISDLIFLNLLKFLRYITTNHNNKITQ